MPFNSYEFIFAFLPIVVGGFWLLVRFAGRQYPKYWLLLASLIFYVNAGWKGFAIIIPSILLDYGIASALISTTSIPTRIRATLFAVGVAANIGFLAYFKYKNFFLDTANSLFSTHYPSSALIIPLGVSFLTFQKLAFLTDVRSGAVQKIAFVDYLLFCTLYPRTVAGPITRYNDIVPQFDRPYAGDAGAHFSVGAALFSVGLFKKSFIADQLSQFVSPVFDIEPLTAHDPGVPTLVTSWAAILVYTLQLYFDFSGYSDMALGVARMVGIVLPMNFNSPLKATSIVDFWGRWHISLTQFLTAYIYTPLVLSISRARMRKGKSLLQGKRSSAAAVVTMVAVPTLITMAVSGIWHGAGWQFIVWGLLHGTYLTVNQSWRIARRRFWPDTRSYTRIMTPVGFVLTLTCVVTALVFFRANSVSEATSILSAMVGANGVVPNDAVVMRPLIGTVLPGLALPLAPWIWIVILFLWVTVLPNSLELLRAYGPALDYPAEDDRRTEASQDVPDRIAAARSTPTGITFIPRRGIPLNGLAGIVAALLCLAGILMLGSSAKFIYWNF